MGFFDKIFGEIRTPGADDVRVLNVPTGYNVRELGGFDALGGPTLTHRFLRSGSTRSMNRRDIERLTNYGVKHVVDLRGWGESPQLTCVFARVKGVRWENIELYGRDISDRALLDAANDQGNYLATSYLTMLSNHESIRRLFGFFAEVPHGECTLFHCAAGMDRTGMTSMLLLGLVGVRRNQIVKDYLYSFGTVPEVDKAVDTGTFATEVSYDKLAMRNETINQVYDVVNGTYGSIEGYLHECGITDDELAAVRAQLLEP